MPLIDWKRKRHPDDVPTPIAVALADFCRRAKTPASPGLVREALSVLTSDDDFRVKELADGEPPAKPLGPFAAIDLILGTAPEVATQRESTGYYALVYTLVQERAKAQPPFEAPDADDAAESAPPRPSSPKAKAKKKRGETVNERIQPQVRAAEQLSEADLEAEESAPLAGANFLTKRDLPQPRGRYTRVEPSKTSIEMLTRLDAKDLVTEAVEQVQTRHQLRQSWESSYVSRGGLGLTTTDIETVLSRHGLLAEIERKERELILVSLTEHRGSLSRAASTLGIPPNDLQKLIDTLSLKREVVEIRDRFIREALNPHNLSHRLDLLGRTKYLDDLRIEKKFREALVRDLKKLLDESKEATSSSEELVAMVAKKHAVHAELLERAMTRLGLMKSYAR